MIWTCTQIGAFAGLRWVKESGHSQMLGFAGCSALIGQRPAIYKELLICYLRWDKMLAFQLLFILLCQILLFFFLLTQWLFCLKDYEKACDAFLDGLKLDPANVVIEKALRYCTDSSYLSLSSDSMSDNSDFHTHILFRNFVVSRYIHCYLPAS